MNTSLEDYFHNFTNQTWIYNTYGDPASVNQWCRPSLSYIYVIYSLNFAVFICGVVGNCITIIKVATDSRLHTPTFMAILCLAVADLLTLLPRNLSRFQQEETKQQIVI